MGPFPRSTQQNEYLLVIVDYFSKWVEVFPTRAAKSATIEQILIEEIFTRWGTPDLCPTEVHNLPPTSLTKYVSNGT